MGGFCCVPGRYERSKHDKDVLLYHLPLDNKKGVKTMDTQDWKKEFTYGYINKSL